MSKNSKPKSLSSPVDPTCHVPKFDTQHGTNLKSSSIVGDSGEDSVYIFQHIKVKDKTGLVFYDSGATGHCVRGKFAEEAGFKVVNPETQQVGAFGNHSLWTDYGTYRCILGSNETGGFDLLFQGISSITGPFPCYSWSSINSEVRESGFLSSDERLPTQVGGTQVDILIGMRTPELIPKLLFKLPSGLAVFRCQLTDVSGSTIAYGGSHKCISYINKHFSNFTVNQLTVMFSRMASQYMDSPWIDVHELPLRQNLGKTFTLSKFQSNLHASTPLVKDDLLYDESLALSESSVKDDLFSDVSCAEPEALSETSEIPSVGITSCVVCKASFPLDKMMKVIDPEDDHLVTFRCPSCEDCPTCKSSPSLQSTSIKERAENSLIADSVRISLEEKKTYVKLPFLQDPVSFFTKHFNGKPSNYSQAERRYLQQCRKSEDIKDGIRKAFQELLDADFIGDLDNAPAEVRDAVSNSPINHLYPWSAVYKQSKTTPVRLVVDPSSSHLNLNVAKGSSGLANMHSILLRARSSEHLWTSDVRKLYNCLHLETEAIPYSLFLYHPSLDPNEKPKLFYMKRAWYGVRSTGPQSSETFRRLADIFEDTHPL